MCAEYQVTYVHENLRLHSHIQFLDYISFIYLCYRTMQFIYVTIIVEMWNGYI